MASPNIILFTYDLSVYGRKVDWYLTLRGIKYSRCLTRAYLPREQLQELGVKYRRIPIMAIGKDVYCDTRLILQKLEDMFPENRLGSQVPAEQAVEYLLENWVNDAGPFWRTAQLIPAEALTDKKFLDDRTEMTGRPFTVEGLQKLRPDALSQQRQYLDFIEHKLLGDGRKFVLGDKPGLADVHCVWVWDWAFGMQQHMHAALEKNIISKDIYPRAFAWVERFREAIKDLGGQAANGKTISDEDAIAQILSSDFAEPEGEVDPRDPLRLKKGQTVEMFPTDSGMNHHDRGTLSSIGFREAVIDSDVPGGKGHIRIHYPRTNFAIKPTQATKL